MEKYKLHHIAGVTRMSDGACVPFDIENSDYRQYLAWISEGNTPEPADPLPNPRIEQIKQELATLDLKSIRAIRENNIARISELELQAELLRTELGTIL